MKTGLATSSTPRAEAGPSRDALDELYEHHAGQVKRWARRLAGPSADLEDLVHDIFIVALNKRWKDRGEASIDTWLFRIAHNLIRGKRRRARIRQCLFGKHQETVVPPPSHTPHEQLEDRERHARLYAALDRLPDAYRTTLILYELEELPGERVAELTGVHVGTVWVRLHRGREQLFQLLAKENQP